MPRRRWRVRLSAAAERDFLAIIEWTAEAFGMRQGRAYGRTLMLALTALGDNPKVADSQSRDDIRPGLRSLHVARKGRRGRHVVLYRVVEGNRVEVVRILHDSMDLIRHVPAWPSAQNS